MITSKANPTIKEIRHLRERKERLRSGLYYLEGLRIIGEAVQQGVQLETLITAPEMLQSDFGRQLVQSQAQLGIPVLEVSEDVFRTLALKDNPQGLAAVAKQHWTRLEEVVPAAGDVWVALDAVADPGNLGTILRTLDAVGGQGLILLEFCTDPYDPTAMRASMGALFSQKLVRTSFNDFWSWKAARGVPVFGTSDAAAQDYHTVRYPSPLVILMGSERQGLPPEAMQQCETMLRIPMVGGSDSLNLAVATAVVLYEGFNQRRE